MNIGFFSYWFPRGQSYVTKQIISIIKDNTNHNVFLLSRKGHLTYTTGEWDFKNLEIGPKEYNIAFSDYKKWIISNKIDVVFFFQNYQFKEIEKIRKMGVKTVGTFMWEQFNKKHVKGANSSYDHIYVLHKAQHLHMRKMGVDADLLRWGVHPSSIIGKRNAVSEKINILIPNGYNTERKNINLILNVISKIKRNDIIFQIMSNKKTKINLKNVINIDTKFENQLDFLKQCSRSDIYLVPSLWEGLGFALYEAHALGKGIMTPNYPPMSDHVEHGSNGILLDLYKPSITRSGIKKASINPIQLTNYINNLTKEDCKKYKKNSAKMLKKYSWKNTEHDFLTFINKITKK